MTRLSPSGAAVAVVAALSAVAAWRWGWDELWAVAAAGATVLALAWLSTRRVAPLSARRIDPVARVTAGDAVPSRLRVVNHGRTGRRPRTALDRIGEDLVEVPLAAVPAGGEVDVAYSAPARRRGVHRWGPVTIGRGDALGLFEASSELAPTTTLIVHPRQEPMALAPAGRRRDLDGLRTDLAEGSITFHALREYVPGDDLRRVHWRSTARTGTMVVRQDVDPSEPRTVVFVDHDAGSWTGDALEEGLVVAASLAAAAARAGYPLALVDGEGRVVDGGGDAVPVLDALAAVDPTPDTPLDIPLLQPVTGAAGLAVVVTGSIDVARNLADRAAASADRAVLVHVEPGVAVHLDVIGRATVLAGSTAREVLAAWRGAVR